MNSNNNTFNKFSDLSIEAFKSDQNTEMLFHNDINSQDFIDKRIEKIKRLNLKAKAQLGKIRNETILYSAKQKFIELYNIQKTNIKENIINILHSKNPQFQFRNIDKLESEDLQQLFDDIELLKIIDNIENTDDGNK